MGWTGNLAAIVGALVLMAASVIIGAIALDRNGAETTDEIDSFGWRNRWLFWTGIPVIPMFWVGFTARDPAVVGCGFAIFLVLQCLYWKLFIRRTPLTRRNLEGYLKLSTYVALSVVAGHLCEVVLRMPVR